MDTPKKSLKTVIVNDFFFSRHYNYIMMSDNSLPVMNKPVDMMEVGPNGNNLQAAARRRHPVEELQRQQGTLSV